MKFTLAISKDRVPFSQNRWLQVFIVIFFAVWAYSFYANTDLANWVLENVLTFAFVIFLFVSYRRHQMSDLSYLLICVYLCLHVYGSTYTYAENPLGYWLKDVFDTKRNHYDRIVHFSFGFLLAYPMREFFLRWVKVPRWAGWALPIEVTMSISALYELIEWAVADVFFKAQGDAYLGTQGDIWDAQKDIFLAFSGAIIATTIVTSIRKIFNLNERTID